MSLVNGILVVDRGEVYQREFRKRPVHCEIQMAAR